MSFDVNNGAKMNLDVILTLKIEVKKVKWRQFNYDVPSTIISYYFDIITCVVNSS